jgi:hypothetical protein
VPLSSDPRPRGRGSRACGRPSSPVAGSRSSHQRCSQGLRSPPEPYGPRDRPGYPQLAASPGALSSDDCPRRQGGRARVRRHPRPGSATTGHAARAVRLQARARGGDRVRLARPHRRGHQVILDRAAAARLSRLLGGRQRELVRRACHVAHLAVRHSSPPLATRLATPRDRASTRGGHESPTADDSGAGPRVRERNRKSIDDLSEFRMKRLCRFSERTAQTARPTLPCGAVSARRTGS